METFGEGRSCTSEIVRKKITVNAENQNQPSKEKDHVSKPKTELSTHEQLEDCIHDDCASGDKNGPVKGELLASTVVLPKMPFISLFESSLVVEFNSRACSRSSEKALWFEFFTKLPGDALM